jgi:fatty-acyl-CoA synthase
MDASGVVRIKGRLREVIIRGGENIYPAEIEDALLSHPAVAMAAVVGVEHARLGQEVGAVIQLRPGRTAPAHELEAHVEQRIARFKTPRHWRYVEAMPLTVSGKIRKVELEAMFR